MEPGLEPCCSCPGAALPPLPLLPLPLPPLPPPPPPPLPCSVDAVAKAAVSAVLDPAVPPGVMDVWTIEKYS